MLLLLSSQLCRTGSYASWKGSDSIPTAIFHRKSARWCQRAQTGAAQLTIAETYRLRWSRGRSRCQNSAPRWSSRRLVWSFVGSRCLLVHTVGIQRDLAWFLTLTAWEEVPHNERVRKWFLAGEPHLQGAWQLVNKTSWILCEVANMPLVPVWKTRQSFFLVLCPCF